jgi:hypothetical protein
MDPEYPLLIDDFRHGQEPTVRPDDTVRQAVLELHRQRPDLVPSRIRAHLADRGIDTPIEAIRGALAGL